jgi:hypothetical protein
MTSEVFIILGNSVSFLLGGGCNIREIYVELLVDGVSVMKQTGKVNIYIHMYICLLVLYFSTHSPSKSLQCEETLERYHWDVSPYVNRAGRIRVVDNCGAGNWGHINFDDVRFDWPIEGRSSGLTSEKGAVATPEAGVAYAFRRKSSGSLEPCPAGSNKLLCVWQQQQRFQASDKRTGDQFGYSVAVSRGKEISDASTLGDGGVIVVGAPFHVGFNQYSNPIDTLKEAGAIYLYKRLPELRDALQKLIREPKWFQQQAFIQPTDMRARDGFGWSVAISGYSVAAGAPNVEDNGGNAGASYFIDVEFLYAEYEFNFMQSMENALWR